MERRLLLDVIICQGSSILKLLASKDKALLIGRDTLLVLDLLLHIFNSVAGLHLERDSFAG